MTQFRFLSKLATVGVVIMSLLSLNAYADEEDYTEAFAAYKKNPTAQQFFGTAYGYAIFPTIGKGGFGIGAAHGSGRVYRQGAVTGKTSMTQVSIGLQLGGQAYSQMVFFENKKAFDSFTSGNFEFAAGASAIAINASAQASASTTGTTSSAGVDEGQQNQANAGYTNGMAILQMGKGGLMYEASVAGQKYSYEAK